MYGFIGNIWAVFIVRRIYVLRTITICVLTIIFASGCLPSSSSHLIVGDRRPAISVDQVKVYTKKPSEYEEIAIIDSSSANSLAFSEQGKMDAALESLKKEAAALGANGVLLSNISNQEVIVPITNSYGTTTFVRGTQKNLRAFAIYVK